MELNHGVKEGTVRKGMEGGRNIEGYLCNHMPRVIKCLGEIFYPLNKCLMGYFLHSMGSFNLPLEHISPSLKGRYFFSRELGNPKLDKQGNFRAWRLGKVAKRTGRRRKQPGICTCLGLQADFHKLY